MKLRIQDSLLRLRLTRNEVACLLDHGVVECERVAAATTRLDG